MLRDYQTDVLNQIRENIKQGNKRILVFACTGFGKTKLSEEIITRSVSNNKTVLFTNHRIQLSEQSSEVFKALNPNLIQGENVIDNGSKITVATIQSFESKSIKQSFDIVIIDEVHYAYESKLVQNIINANPNAIIIGLSATPFDEDGCIIDGFNAIIDNYQTEDLIRLGYLTPFECYAPANLSLVNDVEIELHSIVNEYLNLAKNKKFVAFGKSIDHCYQIRQAMLERGIVSEVIDQSVNEKRRKEILLDLKQGNIHGVLSVEILTTGFDEPSIECVILANLSSSIKKYIQCCGRGIRLFEGKEKCILLDFYGNIELHGLPDARLQIIKKTKISRVIDRFLNLDVISNESEIIEKQIKESKLIYLKKIASVLDLYDGKIYRVESELQDDVNRFLSKTGMFNYRQNSGKAKMGNNWVHFASKNGLPDNTLYYKDCSFYVGLELKLPSGRLTDGQKKTLPEMVDNRVLFFICQSVKDVFLALEHVEKHIYQVNGATVILDEIYNLPEQEINYRKKLNIPCY